MKKYNIKLIKIEEEIKEHLQNVVSNEENLHTTIIERIQARLNKY
jgi:hypothetical protein